MSVISNRPSGTSPPNELMDRSCNSCGKKNSFLRQTGTVMKICTFCRQRWYCSKECQRTEWPTHQDDCKKIRAKVEIITNSSLEQIKTEKSSKTHASIDRDKLFSREPSTEKKRSDKTKSAKEQRPVKSPGEISAELSEDQEKIFSEQNWLDGLAHLQKIRNEKADDINILKKRVKKGKKLSKALHKFCETIDPSAAIQPGHAKKTVKKNEKKAGSKKKQAKAEKFCQNCKISVLAAKKERKRLSMCAACKKVRYCTVECQRKDWEKHKLVCMKKNSREKKASLSSDSGVSVRKMKDSELLAKFVYAPLQEQVSQAERSGSYSTDEITKMKSQLNEMKQKISSTRNSEEHEIETQKLIKKAKSARNPLELKQMYEKQAELLKIYKEKEMQNVRI